MAEVMAVMVATGMVIRVDTVMVTAMEVMVVMVTAMVVTTETVIGMATGTGMVAAGTDEVTVIGGMVAGGRMVSVPVGG
jgi:hypothetical protein